MASFTYHHTRIHSRSRSRSRERTPSPPALPRRTSYKRQRLVRSESSDDENDDYPYSGTHRPSRAVARRNDAPSRLERLGIWMSPHHHHVSRSPSPERHDSCLDSPPRLRERTSRRRVSFAGVTDEDTERAFSERVARLSASRRRFESPSPPPAPRLPSRHRVESDDERVRPSVWSADLFRRRERCVSEGFEARERARCRSKERREEREREREREKERRRREAVYYEDDDGEDDCELDFEGERVVRWRRVKRTKTDEWRPLAGWRRI